MVSCGSSSGPEERIVVTGRLVLLWWHCFVLVMPLISIDRCQYEAYPRRTRMQCSCAAASRAVGGRGRGCTGSAVVGAMSTGAKRHWRRHGPDVAMAVECMCKTPRPCTRTSSTRAAGVIAGTCASRGAPWPPRRAPTHLGLPSQPSRGGWTTTLHLTLRRTAQRARGGCGRQDHGPWPTFP